MIPMKKYIDPVAGNHLKWQYRIGKERRLNWQKHILEEGTPMPKPVVYKDIDEEVIRWVEEDLHIVYDDREVPTLKTFSNQRISEYVQAWKYQDKDGNIQMNLKTISRANNPKWGKMYEQHNIPSHRTYAVYYIPVLGENGQVTYDRYSITQPIMVDMEYTIQMITNKFELLNDFNLLVNSKFQGLQCYVFPEGHAMPMVLSDIGDESEYSVDNRKYYSQNYKINLKAYILRPEDIEVTKMPSRWKPSVEIVGARIESRKKKDEDYDVAVDYREICEEVVEDTRYAYRNVIIIAKTGLCNKDICFKYRNDSQEKSEFNLRDIELDNVSEIELFVNNEKADLQGEVKFYDDDDIIIKYRRKDILKEGTITLGGFDSLSIIDEQDEKDRESDLDRKNNEADRVIEIGF